MANVKLSELTEITEVKEDDYFIVVDTSDSNNTKKVKAVNKEEKLGVFGYISTPVVTEIEATDTYYNLAGGFTNPVLENFSVSATGIKYIGLADVTVEIQWCGSFVNDVNRATFSIALTKNGTVEEGSIQTLRLDSAGTPNSMSGTYVWTLSTNDEILIKTKCDKVGSELTATTFTTSLQKFY